VFGTARKLKEEARNQFIARPDDSKSLVVYKWPNNNIPFASLVTVQPDEWAFFIKGGKVVGFLRKGMQRLDGASVPLVKDLIGEYTANRVLLGELYFVSSRQFTNNKFGGSMGELADPSTGVMVGCGVYGQFAFRITDPAKLVLEFVGTRSTLSNIEIVATIKDRLLKVTRSIVNTKIVDSGWDLLRITSGTHNLEFEDAVVAIMPEELECFGIELVAIQDFVVNILPSDKPKLQEIYDRRAKMRLAENDAYGEMANAELLLGAAEGLKSQGSAGAGNLAGLGMGVGIGMGLAGKLAGSMASPAAVAVAPSQVEDLPVGGICPACGASLASGARFCAQCATPVSTAAVTCPTCDAHVAPGTYCSACGGLLGGDRL